MQQQLFLSTTIIKDGALHGDSTRLIPKPFRHGQEIARMERTKSEARKIARAGQKRGKQPHLRQSWTKAFE